MPTATEPPDPALVRRLRAAGCVFAEEEAAVLESAAETPGRLEALLTRRLAGEPLEQVVGWAEFRGLRIRLLPGVFVPRQRSAYLVEVGLRLVGPGTVVLDLGCGSGALAAAVLAAVPSATVYAVDVDPDAVACARLNLPGDRVFAGDLFDALPQDLRGRIDVLLAHAPYVPTAKIALMPPEARDHEHRIALDGGPDGLDVVRRVMAGAVDWLAPGGTVHVETSVAQAEQALEIVVAAGLEPGLLSDPEVGATVVRGRR